MNLNLDLNWIIVLLIAAGTILGFSPQILNLLKKLLPSPPIPLPMRNGNQIVSHPAITPEILEAYTKLYNHCHQCPETQKAFIEIWTHLNPVQLEKPLA